MNQRKENGPRWYLYLKPLHLESVIEQDHDLARTHYDLLTYMISLHTLMSQDTRRTLWWEHQFRSCEWCEEQTLRFPTDSAGPVASLWLHPGWKDRDRPGWPGHYRGPGCAAGGRLVSLPAASQVRQKSHRLNSSCPGCSSGPTAGEIPESFCRWMIGTASFSVTSCKGDK